MALPGGVALGLMVRPLCSGVWFPSLASLHDLGQDTVARVPDMCDPGLFPLLALILPWHALFPPLQGFVLLLPPPSVLCTHLYIQGETEAQRVPVGHATVSL